MVSSEYHYFRLFVLGTVMFGSIIITTGAGAFMVVRGFNTCHAEKLILGRNMLVITGVQLTVILLITIFWISYGLWAMRFNYKKLREAYCGLIPLIFLTGVVFMILLKIHHYPAANRMEYLVSKYETDFKVYEEVNKIQSTIHCCGAKSYVDWNKTAVAPGTPWWSQIPNSCRKHEPGDGVCHIIDHGKKIDNGKKRIMKNQPRNESNKINFENDFYLEGCQSKLDNHHSIFLYFFTVAAGLTFLIQVLYGVLLLWTYDLLKTKASEWEKNIVKV